MTTLDAFAHWTGDACTGDRKRQSLFAEAALQLGLEFPCTAGKGVSGESFTEAADRSLWRHAIGAKAASLFLLSPEGRAALTSTSQTQSSEAGQGTACDPKITTETIQAGARLDADKLAQLALEDALRHGAQLTCVKAITRIERRDGGGFGLAGHGRARQCGCR